MSKTKLDYLGVSAFAESMAMMISSGVTTEEALSLLEKGPAHGPLGERLDRMYALSTEGNSLESCMRQTGIFPDYALEMVKAGERTGNLESVLSNLADYYHSQKDMQDRLRSAVIYPARMVAMIILVLVIMLKLVLPAFRDVYRDLTASTFGYLGFAYGLCRILLVVMSVIVLLLAAGLLMWRRGKKDTVEKALRHIPICASIFDEMAKFRFTSAYGVYLASGENQDDALLDCLPLVECRPVEDKLKECYRLMEQGHSFSTAANDTELYEPIYGRMLVPGEKSGNIVSVLKRLNDLLKSDISSLVSRLVNTLEPLLSGVLMISVGFVLISLMLPLIGMMNSMI
ncbi:MAG: type II secretion system F family protein [Oscillospiraceae bacterium]|nr:type II secretion system F family protein [Oscillospiraceae bacterium]